MQLCGFPNCWWGTFCERAADVVGRRWRRCARAQRAAGVWSPRPRGGVLALPTRSRRGRESWALRPPALRAAAGGGGGCWGPALASGGAAAEPTAALAVFVSRACIGGKETHCTLSYFHTTPSWWQCRAPGGDSGTTGRRHSQAARRIPRAAEAVASDLTLLMANRRRAPLRRPQVGLHAWRGAEWHGRGTRVAAAPSPRHLLPAPTHPSRSR